MLQPILSRLVSKKIILGSGSPRRKEILANVGLPFIVVPSTFEENLDPNSFPSPAKFVEETSKEKALDVANIFLSKSEPPPDLIISADTVVLLDEEIIGKPKDEADAISILQRLSGRSHFVHSCVTLAVINQKGGTFPYDLKCIHEDTEVKFGSLTDEIIKGYVKTGESMDKAGAYAIQGIGGSLIEWIRGDYFNVVGFPLHKFCRQMHSYCEENLL